MRTTPLALSLMLLLGSSTLSSLVFADVLPQKSDHSDINTINQTESSAAPKTTPEPEIELSRVIVESSLEDIYLQPNAKSSISSEQFQVHHNGNINQMLRDSAGVYTLEDPTNPGVAINIRGLSGYGRVNTMVDGVPQTFRNAHGHAAYGGTRLYVQSEFISQTEISRGAVAGAEGSGTLMGSANFKTIDAEDVIQPGKNWGVVSRVKGGNNGSDSSYMLGAGGKTQFLNGEASVVAAWAKTKNSTYKNGEGIKDPSISSNSPEGRLLKIGLKPNDHHDLKLGYVHYKNKFISNYTWDLENKTTFLNYAFTPDNDLIDAKINLYKNQTDMNYAPGTGSYDGRKVKATSKGGDISNTSRFTFGNNWNASLFYGASFNEDQFDVTSRGANAPGTLKKESIYTDLTIDKDIFSTTLGLRYDHWDLSGIRQARTQGTGAVSPDYDGVFKGNPCPSGEQNCPAESMKNSGHKLNPKITLAITPTDWMQLYTTYSHTYRPPTAQETFWGLVPFGNSSGQGIFNNLDLLPESSKGFDVGVNLFKQNIFTTNDHAYFKVNYYDYRVKNFITNDLVDIDREAGEGVYYIPTAMWINRPGKTKLHGFEIEAGYDAGFAYANITYTQAKTKTPMGWAAGINVQGDWLPERYYTLDAGMRLFDQKLILGGKLRYTGSSEYAGFDYSVSEQPSYRVYDLYGSYEIDRRSQVFFTIENVTNRSYRAALSGGPGTDESGRGRTLNVGLNMQF